MMEAESNQMGHLNADQGIVKNQVGGVTGPPWRVWNMPDASRSDMKIGSWRTGFGMHHSMEHVEHSNANGYSPCSNQFPHYGQTQTQMRPSYPPNSRADGMMINNQPRMMSGSGQTPTLNKLLQNPNVPHHSNSQGAWNNSEPMPMQPMHPNFRPPQEPTPTSPSPSPSQTNSMHEDIDSGMASPAPWTPKAPNMAGYNEVFMKMCEMGDEPERRQFLEKLFNFMDERQSTISAMPVISKQPIDLYRLYLYVQEKGGLLETTKTKKWRDVCSALNLGSSGSAGFTLRRNYVKYLFNYECTFDKGGIDPTPILAQIESMVQKKGESRKHQAATSPGKHVKSSSSAPMEPPFPGPNSQSYSSSYPTNGSGSPMMGMYGSQQGVMGGPPGSNSPQMLPANRNVMSNDSVSVRDPFSDSYRSNQGYYGGMPGSYSNAAPRMGFSPAPTHPGLPPDADVEGSNSQQSDDQRSTTPNGMTGASSSTPPLSTPSSNSHAEYSAPGIASPRPQIFPQGYSKYVPKRTESYSMPSYSSNSSSNYPYYQNRPDGQWPRPYGSLDSGYSSVPRAPMSPYWTPPGARMPRPEKPYSPVKQSNKPGSQSSLPLKKDFPPDSVEAIQPILHKRRKLANKDIGPTDVWRVMMSLKSGLLAESTWALETLSILLYDDHTVSYFGLYHLPGLLEVLLDYFRHMLSTIFSSTFADLITLPKSESSCKSSDPVPTIEKPDINSLDHEDNFTMKTRQGRPVILEESSAFEDFLLDNKDWDDYCSYECNSSRWKEGKADITGHIVANMESRTTRSLQRCKFFGKRNLLRSVLDIRESYVAKKSRGSEEEPVKSPVVSDNDLTDLKGLETKCCSVKLEYEMKLESEGKPADIVVRPDLKVKVEHDSETNSTAIEPLFIKSELDMSAEVCGELSEKLSKESLELLKETWESVDEQSEANEHDSPVFNLLQAHNSEIGHKCITISTVLRNLSFIPGNDIEMCKNIGLMVILGRLILLHHIHPPRQPRRTTQMDQDQAAGLDASDTLCDTTVMGAELPGDEWWWGTLHALQENCLVIFSNIAGHMKLNNYTDEVTLPILEGLLHWSVCPSTCAHDPLPSMSFNSSLSPQRLALETLCKLTAAPDNIDLLLATPPFSRIVQLCSVLVKFLARQEEQVLREFSIVVLSNLVKADNAVARAVALQHPAISLLIDFIEYHEQQSLQLVGTHGVEVLRNNPEMIGTSIGMLRRSAEALFNMASLSDNTSLFVHQQSRLLHLVMSQYLDKSVTSILSEVLFFSSQYSVSKGISPPITSAS